MAKAKLPLFAAALTVILLMIAVSSWLRGRQALAPLVSQPVAKPVEKSASAVPRQSQPGAEALAAVPIEPHTMVREVPDRSGQVLQDQVIRQVLPDIPAKALRTIHGTARVAVKVIVNQSGDVTGAILEPGGSPYFSRLAVEAARKWRFVPSDTASREYHLRFEITQTFTKAVIQRTAR
jgi:TonB family protein